MIRAPSPLAFLVALAAAAGIGVPVASGQTVPSRAMASSAMLDSARTELAVGRAWHAASLLREAGAQRGSPAEILLLARAESGWHNHAGVRDLLAEADWLDGEAGGAGWRLLGLAYEDGERWQEAARAYARYAVSPAAESDSLLPAVLARRARALAEDGALPEALAALESLGEASPAVRSWMALELARAAAARGDTAAVRALMDQVAVPAALDAGWRLGADARLAAGDTAGATASFRQQRREQQGARVAEAGVELGLLLLAVGDTTGSLGLLDASVDDAPVGGAARAARALVRAGRGDEGRSLELAYVLERGGFGEDALRAFDRAHRLAADEGGRLSEADRLRRARLMATVRRRQNEALAEFRVLADSTTDERLGARNLEIWAAMRRRQGLGGHVATLRRWLVERYPSSPEAAEVVWDRGFAAESRGQMERALEQYAFVAANARTHARAGQARMRSGQILLTRGRTAEARGVYEAYLSDFPNGRRWEEASFWAARLAMEAADTASARALLGRVRAEAPFSYYAVVGAALLGDTYRITLPEGEAPRVEPGWLTQGLRRLDLLRAAALGEGVESEEANLTARARGSRQVTLTLAEALIARGRTIPGINLGWALREQGMAWDARLARVVYPFPFQELVRREAAERDVDPILMAALIRQESAFDADIVSRAGAVGLMQVMPPTGRQLARAHGPRGFRDDALTTAEVNLHLGSAFLVEMSARYDQILPIVLSAYNAGPTRANRWRRYPEAADALRFTERIPFDETRGYVKNVTRNIAVYRLLYGEE